MEDENEIHTVKNNKAFLFFGRFLAILLIFVLTMGIGGIFLGRQNSLGTFIFDYGDFSIKLPIIYPLAVILIAISMCLVLIKIINIWIEILKSFQKDKYFCLENLEGLKRSAFLLSGFTILQLLLNLIFNYLNVENVSELFNFSIKKYLTNITLLTFNYLAIIVFKKGIDIQKENEEII
ncbi:DUF2975 domain-containing protein [Streptococcus sp. H49]|uniref:DUF2975 domain-containing protein n=1 Tax=Streptococcus huangxiaojuni TaxID=3237239 RepID=UPI0034A54C98